MPFFSFFFSLFFAVSGLSTATNVYIVYMGDNAAADSDVARETHHRALSTVLGSKEAAESSILYSYRHGFSGFAAVLSESQASRFADYPGVVRVVPNRILGLHTTRSWDFLGMMLGKSDGLLFESGSGCGSIIGVLDTGIWPESKSFSDRRMGPVPARWKGICQEGEKFSTSNCNRALTTGKLSVHVGTSKDMKLNLES